MKLFLMHLVSEPTPLNKTSVNIKNKTQELEKLKQKINKLIKSLYLLDF